MNLSYNSNKTRKTRYCESFLLIIVRNISVCPMAMVIINNIKFRSLFPVKYKYKSGKNNGICDKEKINQNMSASKFIFGNLFAQTCKDKNRITIVGKYRLIILASYENKLRTIVFINRRQM